MNSEYIQKIHSFIKSIFNYIYSMKLKIDEYREQQVEQDTKKHMDAVRLLEKELNLN